VGLVKGSAKKNLAKSKIYKGFYYVEGGQGLLVTPSSATVSGNGHRFLVEALSRELELFEGENLRSLDQNNYDIYALFPFWRCHFGETLL
jgi:hypothetical protein